MALPITAAMTFSREHLTMNHKFGKLLVEKLHRQQINLSIRLLKSLLRPEFLRLQPDSKLEKVWFLRKLQQQHSAVDCVALFKLKLSPRISKIMLHRFYKQKASSHMSEPDFSAQRH